MFLLDKSCKLFCRALQFLGDYKYDFHAILRKFKDSIQEEINFANEVENGVRTGENFKDNDSIKIPHYYRQHCTKRLITMEFVDGVNISRNRVIEKEMNLNLRDVSGLLIEAYSQMLFCSGFIHCDAHPGNILVRKNPKDPQKPQLIILDHGFYRKLDGQFRNRFVQL